MTSAMGDRVASNCLDRRYEGYHKPYIGKLIGYEVTASARLTVPDVDAAPVVSYYIFIHNYTFRPVQI